MKKILFLFAALVMLSCESDDGRRGNPFLIDISFQASLNTDLPQYSSLNFAGNSVIVRNQGIRGFVIYSLGNNQYSAFELSDPNHAPNSCSTMTVSGLTATCPCPEDSNSYDITFGQPKSGSGEYGMKAYRVNRSGSTIVVSN
ncbi:hypothetical protein [Nonlabens marinus]|uniref:Rieske domain-containing protein n=1 Tax=Nonlabens marinus S1-08 TaxID=1454201 RepID=W8VZQ3_9FLAO|nr:hypothetical protein [Nonlabens marinus]BAO54976.1 hypothetical protein NMS_0967 [Nonlabens marinus S1-08]